MSASAEMCGGRSFAALLLQLLLLSSRVPRVCTSEWSWWPPLPTKPMVVGVRRLSAPMPKWQQRAYVDHEGRNRTEELAAPAKGVRTPIG